MGNGQFRYNNETFLMFISKMIKAIFPELRTFVINVFILFESQDWGVKLNNLSLGWVWGEIIYVVKLILEEFYNLW
jgi:hypothetical protein